MNKIVRWATLALVCVCVSALAYGQTSTAAAPAPPVSLYVGQVLTAPQHCPNHPGQGVVIRVEDVFDGGTRANIRVTVNCWNTMFCTNTCTFGGGGSLQIVGDSVRFGFWGKIMKQGLLEPEGNRLGSIMGRVEVRDGKMVLIFGPATMRAVELDVRTDELVFR